MLFMGEDSLMLARLLLLLLLVPSPKATTKGHTCKRHVAHWKDLMLTSITTR